MNPEKKRKAPVADGAVAPRQSKARPKIVVEHDSDSEPESDYDEAQQQAANAEGGDESAGDNGDNQDKQVTFASLGLVEPLAEACAKVGWKRPSEIQREVLPYALKGKDIIGLAETGSGKTGAFALPILQALLAAPQTLFALVLAPTRELAFQVSEQFEALGSTIGVKSVVIVGGVDMMDQAIALQKKPHIIVGSPGRVVDHLENTKGFNLRSLKFLVMDEADRLLNMDFEKEIDKILQAIPRQRNTFLFSATMTSQVAKLQRASLQDPVKVSVSKKYQTAAGLVQNYLFLPAKYKDCYLVYLLNDLAGQSAIIFTSTCEHTQRVALLLRNLGFPAIPIHGKLSQPKRLGALAKFKAGTCNILIATDVASRGLDIPSVQLVINYDIPQNSKDYIHRVGRTARAGRTGRAIALVTQYDVELYQRIENLLGKKLDAYPCEEETVLVLLERVTEAQRLATIALREEESTRKQRRQSKGAGDDDEEEGGSAGPRGGGGSGRGRGGRGGGRGGKRGRGKH